LPEYDLYGKKAPIEINGFKSKLEKIASEWLTEICGLKIIYEPFTYKTKIGNYTPDFYAPETNQYFECKPNLEFANIELYKQFCKEKETDLIIITPNNIGAIEFPKHEIAWQHNSEIESIFDKLTLLIQCQNCGKNSFCSNEGSYHCRACNFHDGDHDTSMIEEKDAMVGRNTKIVSFESYYIKRSKELRVVRN
jgi:hypothetical protein